ncbi:MULTISPECIES: DUF305 domain-containing protein [Candidatus Nanopelagicaceae]|jgi:uncharacterized protein (DUF305 family)|uniref:DUF305 domain-containing protein n=2 Tax=Candidatus Nanopelagicaceae TaxID=2162846 RepID=A0A249JZJ0_9ACTN|nr:MULTISPECIES: DUF305 domain-containing protein [Candidatus Nanopelagicaceae]ASY09927.2 DUF305 domain-containing protein [Candidatus Nanopelagicus limnes]
MLKKISVLLLAVGVILIPSGANASTHAKSLQNLGMNEIMFAQMMIPHHEQAISMSETALKKSRNQAILKLSNQIKSLQGTEKSQLAYWLKATDSSMTMDHDMQMSGMLTTKELASLKRLTGTQFDRTFLQLMIKHHQGAIEMLDLISDSRNAEAKALAKAIKSAQSKEITSMKLLLNKLK